MKRSMHNRNRNIRKRRRQTAARQAGFTLVEMLVATALMVVIMTLFAETFGIASELISKQKGIARNDQVARTMTSMIITDVRRRSFRDVIPFFPGQDTTAAPGPNFFAERRRGFFSISENDPTLQTDDVLHFTIDSTTDASDPDQLPLTGRAVVLTDGTPATDEEIRAYLFNNPDQPEFDDGQVELEAVSTAANLGDITGSINFTGASRAAEVCYFLRNGNLYRRVLLIRDPYIEQPGGTDGQPEDNVNTGYFGTAPADYSISATPNGSGEFWRDFAYSSFYEQSEDGTTSLIGVKFHDFANSLSNINDNLSDESGTALQFPISLGIPHLRFGSSRQITTGVPREFVGTDFIGRFTARETAHTNFGYPGRIPTDDPHVDAALTVVGGEVSQFADEDFLIDEDLLMTNVHEFDVKVWEDNLVAFKDLGHADAGGFYGSAQKIGTSSFPNSYDTWHPYKFTGATPESLGTPPYRPNQVGPDTLDPAEEDELGTDDEIPLRGISVRIRYLDTQSNQMRQVTLNLSLID